VYERQWHQEFPSRLTGLASSSPTTSAPIAPGRVPTLPLADLILVRNFDPAALQHPHSEIGLCDMYIASLRTGTYIKDLANATMPIADGQRLAYKTLRRLLESGTLHNLQQIGKLLHMETTTVSKRYNKVIEFLRTRSAT
jgi:hypothetical protein